MNHKEKLLEIFNNSSSVDDVKLPTDILTNLKTIGDRLESQKGVYTVLITLGIHKVLHPGQDIRYHQENMTGGFSGRSVDTKYITPTLKQLGLTSMSESGWLTRSLEQPYPYTLNYNGKINDVRVKKSFLFLVDKIQNEPRYCEGIIRYLLFYNLEQRRKNHIEIQPIDDPEKLTIQTIISCIEQYFEENYHISGGSKIPVISFYSIYQILITELKRYENCHLKELGSHTTCDRTSKSSGDIEIFENDTLVESLEIKFGIEIDSHIVNRVLEKIYKYNPKRYYILSTNLIKVDDYDEVITKIYELKRKHGCQLIINGLIPTLKYYLRLISDLEEFVTLFTKNILSDSELKNIHKTRWEEIYTSRLR